MTTKSQRQWAAALVRSATKSAGKTPPRGRVISLPKTSKQRPAMSCGSDLSEAQIHMAVVRQLRTRGNPDAVWFHVPNGSKASPGYRRKLAALGLRPGVSDIIALHNGEAFALELKRSSRGVVSEHQNKFLSDWRSAGGHGVVAEGLDEALAICKAWGLLK
jgi:hypothetical protein